MKMSAHQYRKRLPDEVHGLEELVLLSALRVHGAGNAVERLLQDGPAARDVEAEVRARGLDALALQALRRERLVEACTQPYWYIRHWRAVQRHWQPGSC